MRDEVIQIGADICYDLIITFRRLDLFEETLSNRVVKSMQASRLYILHRDGSEAAAKYWNHQGAVWG